MAAQGVGRGGPQPLSVGDALLYLDQVKIEFSDKPEIYNEFLDIMKNFKAQEIDTPGVIQRVSTLFRGYNKLILGFNTFLPEGYKIDLHQLEEMDRAHREREAKEAAAAAAAGQGVGPCGGGPGGGPIGGPMPGPAGAQGGGGPPVEFKQAKDYVTTIKKRFASEPHQATYKAFLKILHHYQARPAEEQRNIMDVLEQVSTLFADHPDLLKEFTYFLPDAVQEQAKERLNRAARESEIRKAQRQADQARQGVGSHGGWERGGGPMRRKEDRRGGMDKDRDRYGDKRDIPDRKYDAEAMRKQKHDVRRAKKRASKALRTSDLHSPFSYTVASERQFFDHVKETLQSLSKPGYDAWAEFLKFLNLYSNDVLSRKDMLGMLEDVFGKHKELYDEFKMMLNARGASDSVQNDLWYSMPLSEIDFSQCRKCTPSYRALPKDYPKPPCTERSPAEEAVLNDTWVSVPVGSEENYSFKHMRRNQYEEALFKCEDERFEIDMVIDSNTATIRVLEPLAEEIQQLIKAKEDIRGDTGGPPTTIQYKLDKRTLGIIHLNAITRIYGDHGLEVLELLRKNPAGAIPVVLRRLKQKDLEWRKARQDLNKTWKELLERNYHKSLDHRSFYFGQSDKKAIQPKMLVQEIKEKKAEFEGTPLPTDGAAAPALANGDAAAAPDGKKKTGGTAAAPKPKVEKDPVLNLFPQDTYGLPQILLRYPKAEPNLHKDVYEIVMYAVEHSSATVPDKEKIARLWRDFLKEMLRLPASTFAQDGESKEDDPAPSGGASIPGALPTGEESFIGTHSLYVFFRLHNILYERLKQAREISESVETVSKTSAAHPLKAMRTEEPENEDPFLARHVKDGYQGFKSLLEQRLDQSFENAKFEDGCRMLMGNRAYMLFTLDKVVTSIVKQLQHLVDEDVFTTMQKVYKEEKEARGGRAPADYRAQVAKNLKDNGHAAEELYRITYVPGPKAIGGQKFDDSLMLLEYLGLADEGSANKGIGSLLDEARNMDEEEEDEGDEEPSEEDEEEGGMDVDHAGGGGGGADPSAAMELSGAGGGGGGPSSTGPSPRTAAKGGPGAGPPTGYFGAARKTDEKNNAGDKPYGTMENKPPEGSNKRPLPDGSEDKTTGLKKVREAELF